MAIGQCLYGYKEAIQAEFGDGVQDHAIHELFGRDFGEEWEQQSTIKQVQQTPIPELICDDNHIAESKAKCQVDEETEHQ